MQRSHFWGDTEILFSVQYTSMGNWTDDVVFCFTFTRNSNHAQGYLVIWHSLQ